jgi:hypothetical protein
MQTAKDKASHAASAAKEEALRAAEATTHKVSQIAQEALVGVPDRTSTLSDKIR